MCHSRPHEYLIKKKCTHNTWYKNESMHTLTFHKNKSLRTFMRVRFDGVLLSYCLNIRMSVDIRTCSEFPTCVKKPTVLEVRDGQNIIWFSSVKVLVTKLAICSSMCLTFRERYLQETFYCGYNEKRGSFWWWVYLFTYLTGELESIQIFGLLYTC